MSYKRILLFASLLLTSTVLSASEVSYKETFPRLGGMNIGGERPYDEPGFQRALAKLDYVVLNVWRNWRRGGKAFAQVVKELKERNPNLLIFQYTNVAETRDTKPKSDIVKKVSSEKGSTGDWWARDANGNRVSAWPNAHNINITDFVSPDANGDRYPQWLAKRNKEVFFGKIPELTGVYIDVYRTVPRVSPDWNGDGVNDNKNDEVVQKWYQAGQRAYSDALRTVLPQKLITVNATSWKKTTPIPEVFRNAIDGGFLEHVIGMNWSIEGTAADGTVNHWGSWEQMMALYRKVHAAARKPNLTLVNVRGYVDDYRLMRYGLASTLMDDGYFDFTDHRQNYATVPWFDEYDLAGEAKTDWLGKAIDPPQTSAWKKGVYRRRFENGLVLVNPRENGTQTLEIERGYRRFQGKQDPKHNNGQAVRTLTLRDADGILLVKESATGQSGPKEPTGVRLEVR